jgi:putative spermidine/putrescine transport system ATP-binding protein
VQHDATGSVIVNVRPEAICVEALPVQDVPRPNQAPATIEQILYRGSLTHLHLRLDDGGTLLAYHQNRAGALALTELAPGSRVLALWAQESNCMVSED